MKRFELDECVALTNSILDYLIAVVPQSATVGVAGAQINADIGSLRATAGAQLSGNTFPVSLVACFYDAIACGISLQAMSNVRANILALTAVSTPAIQLVRLAELDALVMESKIIASMTLTSSNQVETLIAQMQEEFDLAVESAADVSDNVVYQALTALLATVVDLLVKSSYALPYIATYTLGKPLPSLVLAQILYADASRADELAQENKVVHPAFLPVTGTALSQ